MQLLKLTSSLFSAEGQSSRLADEFTAAFVTAHPQTHVISRDLAQQPLPHLSAARFTALVTPAAERTPEQAVIAAEADALVAELRDSQVLVLGLPMYNFGVPSTLKAYFDHVARAGVTFRYTENGPQGLLTGKKVYVLATRGGRYVGTALDSETAYIRDFLGFLGMTEVEFIYAEALNMGGADAAWEAARAQIAALLG